MATYEQYSISDKYIKIPLSFYRLGLKANELILLSVLYQERNQNNVYNGGLKCLCIYTNTTKATVLKHLQTLIKRGFITKKQGIDNKPSEYQIDCNYISKILADMKK